MPRPRAHASAVPGRSGRRTDRLLDQYASNLPRHLIGVAHAAVRPLAQARHASGAVGAASIQMILRLARPGPRITDLARHAGITQQAAGQLVAQLERRRILARHTDPSDRRALALRLTPAGRRLVRVAARAERASDRRLAALLGTQPFAAFRRDALRLFNALVVADSGSPPLEGQAVGALALALNGLAAYCERALMERAQARGYPALKMSFSQVLTHLAPHGVLISDLAALNGVSKQAISQVVRELESLGFIERREHAGDRRSTLIFLSADGLDLIRASIANIALIEADFARVLGAVGAARFAATLQRLCQEPDSPIWSGATPRPDSRAARALRQALERLYAERGDAVCRGLFVRSGSTARLAAPALRLLAGLDIRVAG